MNSGLDDQMARAESQQKPTKRQVRTELHYDLITFFDGQQDFKTGLKELIYIDFKRYLPANGSDSMKKEVNTILFLSKSSSDENND